MDDVTDEMVEAACLGAGECGLFLGRDDARAIIEAALAARPRVAGDAHEALVPEPSSGDANYPPYTNRKFINEGGNEIEIDVALGKPGCLCRFSISSRDSTLESYTTRMELEYLRGAIEEVLIRDAGKTVAPVAGPLTEIEDSDRAWNTLICAAIQWAAYMDQWDKFQFDTEYGPVYVNIGRATEYPDSFDRLPPDLVGEMVSGFSPPLPRATVAEPAPAFTREMAAFLHDLGWSVARLQHHVGWHPRGNQTERLMQAAFPDPAP